MKRKKVYNVIITEEVIRHYEELLSSMYIKAKNPCTSSKVTEDIYDRIMDIKTWFVLIGAKVNPPNNRNEVHIEMPEEQAKYLDY